MAETIFDVKMKNTKLVNKPISYSNSRHSQILIQIVADLLAIFLSYTLFFIIRFESGLFKSVIKPGSFEIMSAAIFFVCFWVSIFFFFGLYKNWYERSPFDEIWAIFKVTLIGCAILIFAVLFDSQSSPRKLFVIYAFLISFTVLIGRTIARNIEKKLRKERKLVIPAIIIGTPKRVLEFYHQTELSTAWGYKTIAMILLDKNDYVINQNNPDFNNLLSGSFEDLDSIIDKYKPEEIIIASDKTEHQLLLDIVSISSDKSLKVKIETDLYDIFTGQAKTQNLYGIPLIEISTQLLKPWQEILKRIFDIVFSTLVILLGLPIWVLVAILVKIDSPGPFFYTQPRVGKNGRIFKIFKFRSMKFEPVQKKESWTVDNDPRVTKFGKFIRKTHLDEIPQFWNVFIGDMSVVGPRPEQPNFVQEFTKAIPHYKRRLKVRPGITGWWQIKSQKYQLNLDEIKYRLKDDFYYIENMSIKLDIEIVVRTVWCVITGHGQA
ncbi:MAG TPA: sugar transferase [Candidatus Kapabacteria bacterium]|nr:sugar transferase [Candidatus Kapabacteria bacterium]